MKMQETTIAIILFNIPIDMKNRNEGSTLPDCISFKSKSSRIKNTMMNYVTSNLCR